MHIIDLSPIYTLIHISGEKAESLLQGQLTCDVREIFNTQTRLSAHCNPKGRVLSSFHLLKYLDAFYFCAPSDMAESIIKQLTPYARFSKVTLAINTELSVLGIWGDNVVERLNSLFEKLPQTADEMVSKEEICLIHLHGTNIRFMMIGHKNSISAFKKTHADALTENTQAWQLLDIQSGVAIIHPETSTLFTPHMLNYPDLHAVSFKKGCYTGQEVIARTHYLGKAKRHLYCASIVSDQAPQAGDVLLDETNNEVGVVVNSAFNTTEGHYDFLAVIQDQSLSTALYLYRSSLRVLGLK